MIEMAPIGSRHAAAVAFLTRHFTRAVGDAALAFDRGIRLPLYAQHGASLQVAAVFG
jgi:hypothetical protein